MQTPDFSKTLFINLSGISLNYLFGTAFELKTIMLQNKAIPPYLREVIEAEAIDHIVVVAAQNEQEEAITIAQAMAEIYKSFNLYFLVATVETNGRLNYQWFQAHGVNAYIRKQSDFALLLADEVCTSIIMINLTYAQPIPAPCMNKLFITDNLLTPNTRGLIDPKHTVIFWPEMVDSYLWFLKIEISKIITGIGDEDLTVYIDAKDEPKMVSLSLTVSKILKMFSKEAHFRYIIDNHYQRLT